ncbi:MAG: hypothetical protein GY896_23000 [Gammaproteobacteria bacterium]|nr:hypothetical protein [Gammaproteobacteria bacterium]
MKTSLSQRKASTPAKRAIKDFCKTLAHLALTLVMLVWIGNILISHDAKATAQDGVWMNAAQLETLRLILNTFGVATWPNFASDPYPCTANVGGAYYFNTTAKEFRVCDESSWAAGGGGVAALNDLSDVTIAAPSDGQALVYDGVTDMRWENTAQSASDLNDLADVEAPAPSDGDIVVYDGVTDMRWESTAGAAPTTLAGLSDTTITTPAEGDYLIRNGTDWKNVNPSGSYVVFPYNGLIIGSVGANAVIALDNDVRVFRASFPYACEVDSIEWIVDSQTGTGCDFGAVALYSLDGNTKIIDSSPQAYSTNDTIISADITDTYVEQGTYFLAYTADETSTCTIRAFAEPTPTTLPGIDAFLNDGSTLIGTAANQSVSGAMPATLGVITPNNNIDRPVVKFTCVDP